MPRTKIEESLQSVIDLKQERIEELERENERLARELEGSLDGWRVAETIEGGPDLPTPRLELAYKPLRGWTDYKVVYRLVTKHLLGHMVAHPMGYTKVGGGGLGREPQIPVDLPFRDGAHARYDSAMMGIPLYTVIPGQEPTLVPPGRENTLFSMVGEDQDVREVLRFAQPDESAEELAQKVKNLRAKKRNLHRTYTMPTGETLKIYITEGSHGKTYWVEDTRRHYNTTIEDFDLFVEKLEKDGWTQLG
jgi:hypothetical protein